MRQRRASKGGDVFPRTKFARIAPYGNNLLPEGHDQQSTNAPKAPTRNLRNRDTNEPSARKGETFFLKFLSHLTPRVLTPLTKPKNTGRVLTKYNKAPRRMHTSKHLEGCTHQSISKDAHIKAPRRMHASKHLEGCTHQSISKDAHIKASRRMHSSKHLEGCANQSTSKDEKKKSRNAQKGNPKGAIISLERILYTLKIFAKVVFRQQNENYNESRPDQHKYSATLHPG